MKILILIGIIVLLYMFPVVRYAVLHPFQTVSNFSVDTYKFFKYHKWNEFKGFGKMTMYVASDDMPFGSGKTLNLVRYVNSIYKEYHGKKIWSEQNQCFVPQHIIVYSNIKLIGIPYIPLTSEQQLINASDDDRDYIVQIFVIDEMGSQFNNRNWKNNLSEDLLNSILQQRKSKIAIIGTVQDFSLFDATLRKLCTSVYECSKYWRFLMLREFYAKDLERASSNTELVTVRSCSVRFATDSLYNSYDTREKVDRLKKDVKDGLMLTNAEILQTSSCDSDLDTLTHIRRKFKNRVKRK